MTPNDEILDCTMTKPKAKLRKLDTEKDQSGSTSGVDQKATEESPGAWFTTEIQAMMHGFGDCSKPLAESAKLIEEIVHQQTNSLLLQLQEIALTRGVRTIGLEDIIFMFRKDKAKLSRLLRYLNVKDLKSSTSVKSAENLMDEGDASSPVKKHVKLCQDFIATIDETGELLSLFDEELVDEVKLERDLRADLLTQNMDLAQYLHFAEVRRTTFGRKTDRRNSAIGSLKTTWST
uniref:Uncharacterized protein n=1 Tax=Strigamia maritima TaxID=126957 RepID=T1JGH6_STRMM